MYTNEKTGRIVAIDARAERDFEPDLFQLRIDFAGDHATKEECVDAYNKDFARVAEALAGAGIPQDELKTSEFRLLVHYDWYYEKVKSPQPMWDGKTTWYRQTQRFEDGYEYSGNCSVEGKLDRELLANVWNALQKTEGDFTYDITYRLESPDACERQILRAAVDEARARAEMLADATGSTLGEVASIEHTFQYAHKGFMMDEAAGAPYGTYGTVLMRTKASEEEFAPAFNPQPINVSCNVGVAWTLE